MHYVGIDLHKRYVSVCALDKSGQVVSERRRLSNGAEAILTWLGELERPVAVALEATLHWAWLHDLLSEGGYEVAAAARKLCCYLYWMLKEGWSYEEWLRPHERREVRPVQTLASVTRVGHLLRREDPVPRGARRGA